MYKISGFFFMALFCHFAYSANLPDFPFVVSVGRAEQEVKPDMVTVSLEIMAFEKESDVSRDKVNEATNRILKILKEYGASSEAIEATDIKKSTKRKRDSEYNSLDILGYEISRSLTIELKNLSSYSELISDIVSVNNVSGVRANFDVSNRKQIERELIELASEDASSKAEQMARSLGAKIHSVYAISQSSDFGAFFATFGARSEEVMADFSALHRRPIAMFAPKNITIRQGINVVFRINKEDL